jgi:hypothetical protein
MRLATFCALPFLFVPSLANAIKREGVEMNLTPNAYACLEQVNKRGVLRKYHVKYQSPMSTRTSSSQENFSKASSASSTQTSTRSIDPGITTGELQSLTEFSSSKGVCAKYLSENKSWLQRQIFVVENYPELRNDVARGGGEYLDTFQHLSRCHMVNRHVFSNALKSHYDALYRSDDPVEFSLRVDSLIRGDSALASGCGEISA